MSDRDELAGELGMALADAYDNDSVVTVETLADALWSAAWRKKPSREDVIDALNVSDPIVGGSTFADVHWGPQADAILALLDGPTETEGGTE